MEVVTSNPTQGAYEFCPAGIKKHGVNKLRVKSIVIHLFAFGKLFKQYFFSPR